MAGDLNNYIFTINPTNDLSPLTVFHFEFPAIYDLSDVQQIIEDYPSKNPCSVTVGPTDPPLSRSLFTCQFLSESNEVEFVGLADGRIRSHHQEHHAHFQHQRG